MKINKNNNIIELKDLTDDEIFSLLKLNIQITFSFTKNDKIIDYIVLKERTCKNNVNCVEINGMSIKSQFVNYSTLLKYIGEKQQIGILSVTIEKKLFIEKESLILMCDKINEELLKSCVYIDYDFKNHVYSIINKNNKGLSDKIFFFEDNNSILAFTEDGPVLIYGKVTSIEDLICQ